MCIFGLGSVFLLKSLSFSNLICLQGTKNSCTSSIVLWTREQCLINYKKTYYMHKSLTVKAFNILAFYPTKQKFTKKKVLHLQPELHLEMVKIDCYTIYLRIILC